MDGGVVSRQPQSHLPPDPTALGGPLGVYSCDDATVVSHYLSEYPPLQPTPATGMQPPTSGAEVAYPTPSPIGRYGSHTFEQMRDVAGLGIQGQISSLGPPVVANTMSTTFSREGPSPAFGQYNGFDALPPPFNPSEGYSVKVEEEPLDVYGRTVSYECFQHQKTVPARRGPFKDNEQRLATARTRKKGSCVRCRMQRIRVSTVCPILDILVGWMVDQN